MPITWTDFDACVNDRIAYYQQQYDQATHVYQKLLKEGGNKQDQAIAILTVQQMMADELSRLRRLLNKYTSSPQTVITDRKLIEIKQSRLN
jgi:wobble nucleotide-excising tRNase